MVVVVAVVCETSNHMLLDVDMYKDLAQAIGFHCVSRIPIGCVQLESWYYPIIFPCQLRPRIDNRAQTQCSDAINGHTRSRSAITSVLSIKEYRFQLQIAFIPPKNIHVYENKRLLLLVMSRLLFTYMRNLLTGNLFTRPHVQMSGSHVHVCFNC